MQPRRSNRLAAASAASSTKVSQSQTTRTKKRSKKVASNPSTKKRKTGLKSAVIPSASLGVIDPESGIKGSIECLDKEPCDVMLCLVDPAKHMDKLIKTTGGSYVVYTRWGRTGTSGQALEQSFDKRSDATQCFEDKFKQKTGLTWNDRNDPIVGNKYRFIQQNFGEKGRGYSGAKWQYWVDDGVDGKTNGWYDYSTTGSVQVEQLYQEHAGNPQLTTRMVDSGCWTYNVNLAQMIQTNIKHANHTSRRIRRCPVGVKMDDLAPVPITVSSSIAMPLPTIPLSPTKSSQAAIVTPVSSPAKPTAVQSMTQAPSIKKESTSPPVDTDIDRFHGANRSSGLVVEKSESDEWYDVVLNQCNITGSNNNNKYYRLQLLKDKGLDKFYVWMKWGRVGETATANAQALKGPFPTETVALKVFAKKYSDKTGNKWGADSFVPKKNKYTRIQIDNDVEVKEEFKVVNVKKEDVEYLPSKLDPKTKELIEVLFSSEMRDEALSAFDLDLKRLPLGVPSKQQIQIGISILNEIEDKLSGGDVSDSYQALSSRFYTVIPHSFGRSKPPVINTEDSLQKRYDMCNILLDMFSTNETVRKIEEETAEKKKVPYPTDSHYKTLNADLSLIEEEMEEFNFIKQYFEKTKSSPSTKLFNVWRVNRHGEKERFQKFDSVGNRKLLWHGTNIAVVAPIITSGLRIMPHSGGRVGSGIYLASMQEKSAWYTSGYGAKYACMFLCESPLGKQHEVTSDGHHASSLKKAPAGYDSVHAIGTKTPKSWTSMEIDGESIQIPEEEGFASGVSSSFQHDEYLVYDEAQVRLRYVVTVKLR